MAKPKIRPDKPHKKPVQVAASTLVAMPWAVNLNRKKFVSLRSCLRLTRTVIAMPAFFWKYTPMFDIEGRNLSLDPNQLQGLLVQEGIPLSTDLVRRHFPPEYDQHAHHQWLITYLTTNPDGTPSGWNPADIPP